MHQILHLAILASVLMGAAGLAVLLLWPLVADTEMPAATKAVLLALAGAGGVLLLVEWRFVH